MHLNHRTYAALLAGALPPDRARALAAHLDGECERCEKFLLRQSMVDRLDGLVDEAISMAFPNGQCPECGAARGETVCPCAQDAAGAH